MDNRRAVLRDRVAQAYHDFGRFCSAHPAACLSFSILTILVLSYPAIDHFHLPEISPIDVHWNEQPVFKNDDSAPDWLRNSRAMFVQQIVIRSGVDPWNSLNLTNEQAVRGPLSLSFTATDLVRSSEGIDSSCFHVGRSNSFPNLPTKGCLLLSPTLFWGTLEHFKEDPNVLETIFDIDCESALCVRDVLLGITAGRAGIKKTYQTNRKRSIDYALTIFLAEYDAAVVESLKSRLSESGKFSIEHSTEGDERTFVHVFYRPSRYLSDYLPFVSTFFVFMLYLYYSARKFEMVSSRFGLAFAAAVNVAATLFMTTGLCTHFDVIPTLWAAEIFPYIALIVGLENTLIITKSVVYTPPTLDVSSRIAHGLSQEGYSLCKYFIIELVFLLVGYFTGVSEIQEFCILATIGLVVDFYMQLFFFTPCLTFDLLRLNSAEKRKFARMMLKSDIPHLKNFTPVRCPMRKLLPRLFEEKHWKKRTLSDSQLEEKEVQAPLKRDRRANSMSESEEPETSLGVFGKTKSIRLALLYFVTRTRIMQRSVMVIFAVWVVWLAFIVHSKGASEHMPLFGVSHRVLESAPQAWGDWQRRTFNWWPELFSEYNMTLSGHYLTFLPPIVVSSKVSPFDPLLTAIPKVHQHGGLSDESEGSTVEPQELRSRINWLETQLKLYLATFFVLLLSSVGSFILYVCFWDKWRQANKVTSPKGCGLTPLSSYSPGFETVPTVFSGHRFPIECAVVASHRMMVSACQEGRLCVWNIETGDRIGKVNRLRMSPSPDGPPPPVPPQIWSIDANSTICVVGCSDGSLEVACLARLKLIGVHQAKIGIIHVKVSLHFSHFILKFRIVDSLLVVGRLDGSVEFIQIALSKELPLRCTSLNLLRAIRAHSKPISHLISVGSMVVSSSHDYTIKVFDAKKCEVIHALLAHNAPVTSICVDESRNVLFSVCEEGVICWWDLDSAEIIRSIRSGLSSPVILSINGNLLIAGSADGALMLYDMDSGQKEGQLSSSEVTPAGSRSLFGLDGELAVTSHGHVITFWNTREKSVLREVNMGLCIDALYRLHQNSVLCQCGNSLYKVNVPSKLSR